MLHKFQPAFVAVLLLIASTYCAAQCVVGPCHPTHAAKQTPPCHQHQNQQPQDESQDCLHSQLVMDSPVVIHMTADLIPAHAVAILPVEFSLVSQLPSLDAAVLHTGPPPPWPSLVLSTSLRI